MDNPHYETGIIYTINIICSVTVAIMQNTKVNWWRGSFISVIDSLIEEIIPDLKHTIEIQNVPVFFGYFEVKYIKEEYSVVLRCLINPKMKPDCSEQVRYVKYQSQVVPSNHKKLNNR